MDKMISPSVALNECMNRTCDNFHSLHEHQQTSVDWLDGHAMWKRNCENSLHEMLWCSLCHFYRFFDFEPVYKIKKAVTRALRNLVMCMRRWTRSRRKSFSRFCRLKSEFRGTHRGSLTFISIESLIGIEKIRRLIENSLSVTDRKPRIIQNRCDFYFHIKAESPSEKEKNSL